MMPQCRTRLEVQNQPSRTLSTERAVTVLGTCRRDLQAMVGGGSTRTRPPVLSPRGPARANHLIHHDAHKPEARRRDASDAEIQSPRTSKETASKLQNITKGIPGKTKLVFGTAPTRRKKHPESTKGQATEDNATDGPDTGQKRLRRPNRPKTPTRGQADTPEQRQAQEEKNSYPSPECFERS